MKARLRRWLYEAFGAEIHPYTNPKEVGWDGWLTVFGILVGYYKWTGKDDNDPNGKIEITHSW